MIKESKDFQKLTKTFSITYSDVEWDKMTVDSSAENTLVCFIPIGEDEFISFIKEGKIKVLYTELSVEKEGNLELTYFYLNKNNYIREYYEQTLSGYLERTGKVRVSSEKALGWWECTTKCYKTASDACDSDPECKTLCDMTGGICNAEMMVACGVACL